ncbi:unnamed protein product, partial [marine sediment metagenome]
QEFTGIPHPDIEDVLKVFDRKNIIEMEYTLGKKIMVNKIEKPKFH